MSLFKEWTELLENQTDETFEAFWKEYATTESKIYDYILKNHDSKLEGTVAALVEKFQVKEVIFTGFLDGIQTSLNNPFDLEAVTLESKISLDIDFDKLFLNMLKAEADYLYSLESLENVLTEERRIEIAKEFKKSKTVVKEKEPGRNDPCPCGSGKKYKKCCGK